MKHKILIKGIYTKVASSLPKGLNYTVWIGLAGRVAENGNLAYTWESKEPTSYTKWNKEMPGLFIRFQVNCIILFVIDSI